MTSASSLTLDPSLQAFVETELLPGTGVAPAEFWAGLAGILASFSAARSLSRTDTVLGGTQGWAGSMVNDPIALSVRHNPAGYGVRRARQPSPQPMLGSQGNVPAVGNAAFALRMAEPWAYAGVAFVAASFSRAAVPSIHGTLLIDPATMVTIGSIAIPAQQTATLALPIPANALLRGSTAERASYYNTLVTLGAMTVNEVRAKEDMPRSTDPEADKLRGAANLFGSQPAPAASASNPNPSPEQNNEVAE